MSTANYRHLVTAVHDIWTFAERIGAKDQAKTFQKLHARLQAEERSSDAVEEEIFKARGLASFFIPQHISKQRWDAAKKELLEKELSALREAINDALFPPKPNAVPEADVKGLAGNAEYTKVLGRPEQAPEIAKHALDVVTRFSTAVFKQDIETAYGLCANELRTWMSAQRFCTELEKAERAYGGKAVECKVEQVSMIWADAVSRQKTGNKQGDWPKDTPKSNKRATVGTFWFTDPQNNVGRWAFFWVVEEAQGYRIAKFNQYLQ
jgi:hypothetical protein